MTGTAKLAYVVLDFDGTFTDVDREALPFTRAFQEHFADVLGKDEDLVRDVWRIAERKVRDEPERFGGFEEGGKIVAPPSDPYLRANAIARILCQRFQVLKIPHLRNEVIQTVFRLAYRQSGTFFQPDAASVLDELLARPELTVAVITNAAPAPVLDKLAKLRLEHRTPLRPLVVGEAHKFGILSRAPEPVGQTVPAARLASWNEVYERVPEEQRVPGLSRPIHLRRGHYFRVLRDHVWKDDLEGPSRTLVCGDVYELDLVLPAALGSSVHLVQRADTPPHEVDAVKALARGGVSSDLGGLLRRLG